MKDQFEKNIKSLVEEFSYDYDPKAWEALSEKLPKGKSGFSTLAKLTGALIIAAGALTFWMLNSKSPLVKSVTQKEVSTTKMTDKTRSEQKQNQSAENTPNTVVVSSQVLTEQSNIQAEGQQENSVLMQQNKVASNHTQQLTHAEQNSALFLNAKQPTQITKENEPETQQQSNVVNTPCKGPKINLDADAINYEDGTPRIKVSADCNGSDITWGANGTLQNKKSRGVELLAFKGQTYTISAQAQLDGCTSTETIKITANEDYNLLAVNAFNPQSRDERNATFMPYALTIRNVHFEMLIIDPDNGSVIFKTTDAQNAWDGIDQRNGQLIPAQKAYIWKVVIKDPLPNEKSTYTGTIVRI